MRVSIDRIGQDFAGGRAALGEISLDFAAGERVAIIGPSGAGKTTLLRILGASLRPTRGEIRLDDLNPWQLPGGALRRLRSRIGTVHQAPPLPPRQRVVTAVLAGRLGQWSLLRGLASLVYPTDISGARDALARVGMETRVFDRCDRLSGGQLQRVGIARVLYQGPDLLLADEPVSALDPELADRAVGELNREAESRGITLIASLHAVDLALNWFPRIIGVSDGGVAFDLPPQQINAAMLGELYRGEAVNQSAAAEGSEAADSSAAKSGRPAQPMRLCR